MMKNAIATATAAAFLPFLPTDVTVVANRYATHLQQLSLVDPLRTPLLHRLRALHAHIVASGFKPRSHILNRLIDLYFKSGDLPSARRLFDESPQPDIVGRTTLINAYFSVGDYKTAEKMFDETPVWMRDTVSYNSMISGYSRAGEGLRGFWLFRDMIRDSFRPDDYTLTSIISAVGAVAELNIGTCRQLHCAAVKYGTESVVSVSNALIALYWQCGCPEGASCAKEVFGRMCDRDELTWTTMIVGYLRSGDIDAARHLFNGMTENLDSVWNAMISGYVKYGCFSEALEMFSRMQSKGIPFDEFTYTSVLTLCADAGFLKLGKAVHAHILRAGPDFDPESALPVENVLVTLYSKCGKVSDAHKVFVKIRMKDIVSWNAMLTGYVSSGNINDALDLFERIPHKNLLTWTMMISCFAQNGLCEDALKLFIQMRGKGFEPCDYIFSGAFAACARLGALELGRQMHGLLLLYGYDSSNSAGNALVTMYAKCGAVDAARAVFFVMPCVDFISWNAMIGALAQHGYGCEAIDFFEEMLHEGIYPDKITFLTILSACNHAGLVDEGLMYFDYMKYDYNIEPGEEHYARLIDLLGKAGKITEAKEIIRSLPFKPGPLIWEAVLSNCRIHGELELGIHAAEQLFEMTPQHDGTYVLLSNMYASIGMWDGVARVRKLMKDNHVKKEPGCSWIEVANKVHVFRVNDSDHPEALEVYRFLKILNARMRKLGYVPNTKFVLHDVELEQKEYVLSTHSEKLAVGYGLLKLPTGATVRVLKNLRICGDCHIAIMFMSKAVGREIIVRDGKRYHHFKDGICSCGNYW